MIFFSLSYKWVEKRIAIFMIFFWIWNIVHLYFAKDEESQWIECHEIPYELKSKEKEGKGTKVKQYQLLCTITNCSKKEHHGFDLRRQSRWEIATHPIAITTTMEMLSSNNDTYKFIIAMRLFEEDKQPSYITLMIMLLMLNRILYTLSERAKRRPDQTWAANLSRAHCHLGVDSVCLTLSKWRR